MSDCIFCKDLPKVLEAVAKFGYKGVEFAGYYGRNAKTLRKLLDDNGLVCCGTHTGYNTVQPKELKQTIEFNKTIGNKYLIVPSMSANSASRRACLINASTVYPDHDHTSHPIS